jgi:hypothetical protein
VLEFTFNRPGWADDSYEREGILLVGVDLQAFPSFVLNPRDSFHNVRASAQFSVLAESYARGISQLEPRSTIVRYLQAHRQAFGRYGTGPERRQFQERFSGVPA